MSDTTTRREVLLAGLAATAVGVTAAPAAPAHFRVAVAGDYEKLALKRDVWKSLGEDAEVVSFSQPFGSEQDTIRALRDFDALALMRERIPISRKVLEKLPRLRVIVFSGLMDKTLDHQAAADRGIIVCRALGMGWHEAGATHAGGGSPSELALALMLACAWHIPAADTLIRQGGWAFQPGIPMRGKTLGIVGYGNIGKPVARFGLALGMRVLAFSRSLTHEMARAEGVERADLETLLRAADVVSIHLPLTPATRGIIGAREIGWLKSGVILINTARAAIVDEAALLEALRAGKIAMAGLDVYWHEPLPATHPLSRMRNVVMTPHVGYVTEASMLDRYEAMAEVLASYRQGNIKGRYTPADAAADERTG